MKSPNDRCHFARRSHLSRRIVNQRVNQRVCQMCNTGAIEDEMHFVTMCNKLRQIRQNTFEKIQNICPNFNVLSTEDKFSYIMNSCGTVFELCGNLIGQLFAVRSNPRGSLSLTLWIRNAIFFKNFLGSLRSPTLIYQFFPNFTNLKFKNNFSYNLL